VRIFLPPPVESLVRVTDPKLGFYSQSLEKRRYVALEQWTATLENIHNAVINKSAASRHQGSMGDFGDYEGGNGGSRWKLDA